MAVTIDATNLVLIDAADSTTGWTSSMGGLATDTVNAREGGTRLADQASTETYEIYHTVTSADYSGRTIFGWNVQGTPATEADATGAGHAMYLGDGTNNRVYAVGGVDNYAFFYNSWPSYRLNTAGLPTTFRQDGGGAPTLGSITRVGYGGHRPVKSNGTADNAFVDVLRYCANTNPALVINGGTNADRGTLAEVVTQDESTSNAWGIIRSLIGGAKAYELMFGIEFGDGTGSNYFEDSDFQLFVNGSLSSGGTISAGSMDVTLVASAGTNLFILTDGVITGVGTVSNWDMSAAYDTFEFSRMVCTDLGTIDFPNNGGTSRTAGANTFNNCGRVYFGNLTSNNHVFNGTTDANGAVLWDENSTPANQDGLTFNSDGTGNAINVAPTGTGPWTFNIDGYAFDNYAGQSGTAGDRVFYIDPSTNDASDITINLTNSTATNVQGGGSGFSYELAAGVTGTPTIQQTVNVKVTVVDTSGAAIQGAKVFLEEDPGGTDIISYGITDVNGEVSTTFAGATPQAVVGFVRKGSASPVYKSSPINDTISSTGLAAVITLVADE